MAVVTRQGLKEYALRNLGAPVVQINVDDSQLEDRIDEALEYFRLYHYDGTEKIYLKHKITSSSLKLDSNDAASINHGQFVTGLTSEAKALVVKNEEPDVVRIRNVEGAFVAGETIRHTDGTEVTLSSDEDFFITGDTENKWIPIPDHVYGVMRVMPFTLGTSTRNIFDMQYQLRLHDLYDLSSTSIVYYNTVRNHLSLLDLLLNGNPMYEFNRLQNRLHIHINWVGKMVVDDYVLVEAYRALDPEEFNRMYGEPWLKHYVTALFKRQWATNGKKFSGMALPGGVSIDFQSLYLESMSEIKELEDDLQNKSAPLNFFLG